MLKWSIVFFVVAIIAAYFGFFGIADTAAWAGKISFFVFLVLAIVSFVLDRRSAV